jgi:uncharacterized protein YjiS (DUF1127 family)
MFLSFTSTARAVLKEWRRRSRSRSELVRLGREERHDLSSRFDLSAEMNKPFWQA